MDFIDLYLLIRSSFSLENIFTSYGFNFFGWFNKYLYIIDLHRLHLRFDDVKSFFRVEPLHDIHEGDQILIILI